MKKNNIIAIVFICEFLFTCAAQANESLKELSGRDLRPVQGNTVQKIDNDQTEELVLLDVDRNERVYKEGENVVVTVTSSTPGYLYLVNFNSKGKATLLVPNNYFDKNFIKANQKYTYPAKEMNFSLEVSGPNFGKETIKAFVSQKKLKTLSGGKYTKNVVTPLSSEELHAIFGELNGRKDIVKHKENNRSYRENDFAAGSITYETIAEDISRPAYTKGQRYALAFGINNYKDPDIENLVVCAQDAKAFINLCTSTLGIPEENCACLINEQVTLERVKELFSETIKNITKPGDIIYIFWSGHGGQTSSTDNTTEGSFDQFLVPSNGSLENPKKTMLMENVFGYMMKELNGRKIVMFLDACHSGGMAKNAKTIKAVKREKDSNKKQSFQDKIVGQTKRGKGISDEQDAKSYKCTFGFKNFKRAKSLGQKDLYVLASSAYDQISFEGENLSVMTKYLIETIENAPNDITHKDLKVNIENKVRNYVQKEYGFLQSVVEQDDLSPALRLKQ